MTLRRPERFGLRLLCAAVLCGILSLGLWPFHVPKNDVDWLPGTNGLRFGKFGTVLSAGDFPAEGKSESLEVWLQPGRIWDFGTFLAFCTPDKPFRLSLQQWQTGLLLRAERDLHVDNVFREASPTFLTVTVGRQGTIVYVDGAVVKRAPEFRPSAEAFAGRLVLGDSAGQADSWSGRLLGLAIYRRELAPGEVLEHFSTWTRQKQPAIAPDEHDAVVYLFDERAGSVVHSRGLPAPDLHIPQRYTVLDQIFLESPWSEFHRTSGFWGAVIKNVIGFIPFGFCFYANFSLVRHSKRAVLITVFLGFAVSLTIEVLQAFLPTRDSGMMDLITNTLGTFLGILAYKAVSAQIRLRV